MLSVFIFNSNLNNPLLTLTGSRRASGIYNSSLYNKEKNEVLAIFIRMMKLLVHLVFWSFQKKTVN